MGENKVQVKNGQKALVYGACFTYLLSALRTAYPVLYVAYKCAMPCNRKCGSLEQRAGLHPLALVDLYKIN